MASGNLESARSSASTPSSALLQQLEYTTLDVAFAPLHASNILLVLEFLGFFLFSAYTDEERKEQAQFEQTMDGEKEEKGKRDEEGNEDPHPPGTSDPVKLEKPEMLDLLARWKKNSPFNLNVVLSGAVIVLPSDPLDVFVEIPLLDVSNR
jgi:hypothetical protein